MKLKLIYEMASFYDDETENMKSDKIDYAEGDKIFQPMNTIPIILLTLHKNW
jgi:hypothetical protein